MTLPKSNVEHKHVKYCFTNLGFSIIISYNSLQWMCVYVFVLLFFSLISYSDYYAFGIHGGFREKLRIERDIDKETNLRKFSNQRMHMVNLIVHFYKPQILLHILSIRLHFALIVRYFLILFYFICYCYCCCYCCYS